MKKLIIGTIALALSAGMAMAQTIRMGTEGAYPPYNFINDAGEIDGFERDVGDELCKRAGLTCEWVKNDWDSIIPNLVSGNYDTIIAGMAITAERDEVIDFTQNYILPEASAYVAASEGVDLKGGACVDVCPVDCIYTEDDDNMFYINPDECIDCALCEPECPVDAIFSEDELPENEQVFLDLNTELSEVWPNITEKKDPLPDAEEWAEVQGKLAHLER